MRIFIITPKVDPGIKSTMRLCIWMLYIAEPKISASEAGRLEIFDVLVSRLNPSVSLSDVPTFYRGKRKFFPGLRIYKMPQIHVCEKMR